MKAWTYAKYIQLVVVSVTKTDLLLERVGRNCFQIAANSGLGHGVSDYRHGDCSSGVRITLATGTGLLRNGRCLREAMVSRQLKAFHMRCKRYMRVRVDRSVRSWIIKSVHIGT